MIIPVFVYGSLRVGEWNYPVAEPCVQEYEQDAATPGLVWFAFRDGYPVAHFISSCAGMIQGDVLWCDTEDPAYEHMQRMEQGAGYEQREIEVILANGQRMDATGFHYLGVPRPDLLITSGDWRREIHRLRGVSG